MVKENQKLFNRLNVLSDVAISFLAVITSYLIIFNLSGFERNYPLSDYLKLLIIFVPVQLLTYGCLGLYDSFRTSTIVKELSKLFQALLIDGSILVAILYVAKIINFSRWALAIFLMLDFALIAAKRMVLRQTLKHFRSGGYNKKYVLIVGGGETARHYLNTIQTQKHMGFECAGYVADSGRLNAKLVGGYDDIFGILDNNCYSEVICALESEDMQHMAAVVEACEQTGTKIAVIPAIYKYMSATPAIDMVGDIPVMNIRRIPLDNVGNAFLKRAMDVVGSLVMLIFALPIMLVSAVIIKITMGGDVIFKQQRMGLNKKIFTMYKLKSMKDNADSDTAWSTDNDPRKTRFGALIRKLSIDELPQLFNVLKGDMSLVGPRPEIPYHVNNFKQSIPMYMIKHQVKPGITGLAQVNGYRGDTSIKRRIEYDIEYIENWNVFLDISILIRTVLSGFVNKEKIRKSRPRKTENYSMNKTNEKTDYLALAIFFPAAVALALVPIILKATAMISDSIETYRLFGGFQNPADGFFYLSDLSTMGKASAIGILAIIMLAVALVCCVFMFRHTEKRMLVYTGASVVYVLMSLMSALGSRYSDIAFNGAYGRAEGFYVTACYFVMFLFTMYAFRKTQNIRCVIIALMISTGVNFILGIFQFTGNNLLLQEWFQALVLDGDFKDMIKFSELSQTEEGVLYGALYHYNYMGSFTGMVIPLFSVLTVYGRTIWQKLLYGFFAAISMFMLFASSARSGIVAIAVVAVVAVIVFGKVLIKHWKPVAYGAAAVFVVLFLANGIMNNALFERIPSLVGDIADFIGPAEQTDLFDTLPVREITHNEDGSVTFTTQTDEINIVYNADKMSYEFTDKNDEKLTLRYSKEGYISIANTGFEGVNFEFVNSDNNPYRDDAFFMWFTGDDEQAMAFYLFNEKQIHMIHPAVGDRVTPVNAEAIGFKGKELLGSSRGYIWSRTIPLLKNCLVTGYGPDTFAYVFPQNDFLAKYYSYGEGFYIAVDKPHNLYIQIFFSNGLIALIAFLAICVIYLVDCFRLYALKKQYRIEQIYGIAMMLAVVGYLAAGLFNDSTTGTTPVFFILLGVGAALNTINRRIDRDVKVNADGVVIDKPVKKTKAQLEAERQETERAAEIAENLDENRKAAITAASIVNKMDDTTISRISQAMAVVNEQKNEREYNVAVQEEERPEVVYTEEELKQDPAQELKKIVESKEYTDDGKKKERPITRDDAKDLYKMVHRFKERIEAEQKEKKND